MFEIIKEGLADAFVDSLKLTPFLFVTYIIMGFLEKASKDKSRKMIAAAGPMSPVIGAALGAFPQCGFSAAASNLYAAGIINMGTLLAVFMSTSDEMIPVFIAEKLPVTLLLKLVLAKIVIGAVTGVLVAVLFKRFFVKQEHEFEVVREEHSCSHGCCHSNRGILADSAIHTLQIMLFIFLITVVINVIIMFTGKDVLAAFFRANPYLGQIMAGLVGLIPNCAASVIISQLYIEKVISLGALMSGLLVSAGVGLLVLIRENTNVKENITIIAILYVTSLLWGFLVDAIGLVI